MAERASSFRPCVLIPTYNNPRTIRDVVVRCRAHLPEVLVVDDGSAAPGRLEVEALGEEGLAHVRHRPANGGKGAAVKTGFEAAAELGYTHALQVDADGQHQLDDIPRFLEASRKDPSALVLGAPVFDASAPIGRRLGREITRFWTNLETGGKVIEDPMCGFRVYPIEAARRARTVGDAMDFDPEIAVRLVWMGLPVVNLETRVVYLSAQDGGVSSFRMFRDNVLISKMHTRLCLLGILRVLTGGRVPRLAP